MITWRAIKLVKYERKFIFLFEKKICKVYGDYCYWYSADKGFLCRG